MKFSTEVEMLVCMSDTERAMLMGGPAKAYGWSPRKVSTGQ